MSISRDRLRMPARTLATTAVLTTTLLGTLAAPSAQAATAPAVQTVAAAAPLNVAVTTQSAVTTQTAVAAQLALAARVSGVLGTAASLKGRPYRYGAIGPSAFDCSGYTKYVYARNGVSLPRTAQQQYRASTKISKSAARPGDLVFLGGAHKYHVGIYAGNGLMWHSPRSGKTVRLVKIWTSNWSAGRVLS